MSEIRERFSRSLNVVMFGRDRMFCATVYEMARAGDPWAIWTRISIDLWFLAFGQANHCRAMWWEEIENDRLRAADPRQR